MTGRRRIGLVVLTLITGGICLMLLTDWLPALRGPVWLDGEWRWPYSLRPPQRWWLSIVAALVMLGVSAWWFRSSGRRKGRTIAGLAALSGASLLLQGSLIYAERPNVAAEIVDRNLAPQTSGYYRTAAEITDLDNTLANYPALMPQFDSEHARTHPPGLVLANWTLIRAVEQAPALARSLANAVRPLRCTDLWLLEGGDARLAGLAVSSLLAPLAAALVIPLAYAATRQIAAQENSLLATALVASLPALLLFAPLADQLLAFLGLLGMSLLLLALKRGSTALHFLAGLVISLASFVSLGMLSLVVIATVLFAVRYWSAAGGRRSMLKWIGAFVLGLGSMWLVYWLVWGIAPWELAQTAMDQHYNLVTSRRRYGVWLGFNALDLLLFAGPAVLYGLIGAIILAAGRIKKRALTEADSLSLGLALLVVLLLISGATRGEVGRIWLFFMPLLAIAAGIFLNRWFDNRRVALVLVALQLLLVVSLGLAWRPVEAVIVRAERPVMAPVPDEVTDLDLSFAEGIVLDGYSVPANKVKPGESLEVVLLWSSDGPASRPYTVFVHLVDSEGTLTAQSDGWAAGGQWPPTCWQAGGQVADPIEVALPAMITPGEYQLMVGLYDASSGQRLAISDGSDAFRLMKVQVVEDE